MPSNHVGRGPGRIVLTGPSEAREALLPALLEESLPGWRVEQASLSMGVLSDVELMLEYVQRAYGDEALPEILVVGLTPRFACEVGAALSPLASSVDEYSPHFRVNEGANGSRLVERRWGAGLLPRLRFRMRQGLRYRNALRAVAAAGPRVLVDPPRTHPRLPHPFTAARYARRASWDDARVQARLRAPNNHFRYTAELDPEVLARTLEASLRHLVGRANELGVRLVFVRLPERSEVRAMFEAGIEAHCMRAIQEGTEGAALLDQRTLIGDQDFFDSHHLAHAGARRASEDFGAWLRTELQRATRK